VICDYALATTSPDFAASMRELQPERREESVSSSARAALPSVLREPTGTAVTRESFRQRHRSE